MENKYLEEYAAMQLRMQRHDFMNYLQVIYGYIQINKPVDALNYIKKINKYMIIIGRVFSLECDAFGMLFQEFVSKCIKYSVEIELELDIEYISCENFSKDIEEKRKLFNMLTDEVLYEISLMDIHSRKLYIHINGLPDNINIIISSVNEIDNISYYNQMVSLFQFDCNSEEDRKYVIHKKDGYIAVLINFKQ